MIPADFIAEWRERAPWVASAQVEQDLVLCRALVEIFRDEEIAGALAFRGGTALYKLHLPAPARYSEDIDLVQTSPGPIGTTLDRLRERLAPWLGEPARRLKQGRAILVFRFESEDAPPLPLRLKVEINSGEHFCVRGLEQRTFAVRSRWFTGEAEIPTYALDELLGTKLRALYQRRKGRDLFDLWWAARATDVPAGGVVECCRRYLDQDGHRVSRALFEANLAAKLEDPQFAADLTPLLTAGTEWDADQAARYVRQELLARFPGAAWKKGSGE